MRKNSKIGTRSGVELYNQVSRPTSIILSAIMILLAAICVLPVFLAAGVSLSTDASLAQDGYQFIPSEVSTLAYEIIFAPNSQIVRALLVSVFITAAGTVIGVILTSTYGFVLTNKRYRLRGLMTVFIVIPMLFSGGLIPSYIINTEVLGLRDSIWALILPLAVSSFNIIIMRTYFTGQISTAILESAEIDGATQLRTYTNIVLPLAKPVLATIAIFLAFGYWNDWQMARLYIRSADLKPLQAVLMEIQGNIEFLRSEQGQQLGPTFQIKIPGDPVRMALVMVIVVPIAMVYPFFQKYFVSGLTIGAVKG